MQDFDNMFVFFKPSAELTAKIIKQNQALVKEYTARTAPEESTESENYEPDFDRFDPGPRRPGRQASRSPVEVGQQVIVERLYNYLSSLSESQWALDRGSFPIDEYLPNGMLTMLGFSSLRKQPESQLATEVGYLMEQLTEEFVNWLANEQNGAFVTPWLEMHLTTHGELLLIAIPEDEVDDSTEELADETTAAHDYVTAVESVAPVTDFAESVFASAVEAGKQAYRESRDESAVQERAAALVEDNF